MSDQDACSVCCRLTGFGDEDMGEPPVNLARCPAPGGMECRAVAQAVAPWRRENETLRANCNHISSENASLASQVESMGLHIESLAGELAKPEDARLREVVEALDGRAVIFDGLGVRVRHLLDEMDEWITRAGAAERRLKKAEEVVMLARQMTPTERALRDVAAERKRQHEKWGEQNLPDVSVEGTEFKLVAAACRFRSIEPSTWASVLLEEVAEAVEETFAGDAAELRAELVQVAAVAVQWIEALDRRAKPKRTAREIVEAAGGFVFEKDDREIVPLALRADVFRPGPLDDIEYSIGGLTAPEEQAQEFVDRAASALVDADLAAVANFIGDSGPGAEPGMVVFDGRIYRRGADGQVTSEPILFDTEDNDE